MITLLTTDRRTGVVAPASIAAATAAATDRAPVVVEARGERAARRPCRAPREGILVAALVLVGCSAGGTDDPGVEVPVDDDAQATDIRGANGVTTGLVWMQDYSGVLDLDTGRTTTVGDLDGAWPRADGKEFVTVTDSVRFTDDPFCGGSPTWFDRVTVFDTATGIAVAGFDVVEPVYDVPRLSPDGSTLAGRWEDATNCFGSQDTAITVWDRDGEVLIRGLASIGAFDWLPDNRLVFEVDGDIGVEQERNTLRYRTIAELGDIPGTPYAFDVSPDGETLVFEMVTDFPGWLETVKTREATVWQVNLDGTGLRQIVDSSRTTGPYGPFVNAPLVSPEGDALMVTENWISGGVITEYGIDGPEFPIITGIDYTPVINGAVTQVLPLDRLPAALPPPTWSADGIRPVFERDDDAALKPAVVWPLGGRSWTVPVTRAATDPGSLPAAGDRPNRSLPGSLYRHRNDSDISAIERLDLASGALSELPVPSRIDLADVEYLEVSQDASRIAAVTYDVENDWTLWVFDALGNPVGDFAMQTGNYHYSPEGAPRFAPQSNSLLAWPYDDDEFGQGAVVLDVDSGYFRYRSQQGYIDTLDWFPNGDLLLVDGTRLLRASRIEDGYASAEPLADVHARIGHVRVHPDGRQVVYEAGRQILVLDLADGTERRLTAWTDDIEVRPEFSPDGRYVVFNKLGSFDFGWPWIVASDAANVRIHEDATAAAGAMRVGEGVGDVDWRISRGSVLWRAGP